MDEDFGSVQSFRELGCSAKFENVEVDAGVRDVLESRGIKNFYSHQAEGIRLVREGKNVVVVAPTASGKSEIYLVPVIEAALAGKRSILVFPTKALSRDQFERLREFNFLGVRSAVYDGDTTQNEREKIRKDFPHILVTNMDMLHHLLLNSRLFLKFWKSLQFIVVDEVHSYSGLCGAHAGNVLRRLKRMLDRFEVKRQFICCSATVRNAREFAGELVGEEFSEVDASSAPKGGVLHEIIVPLNSYTSTAVYYARELLGSGKAGKLLVFGNSHSVVERIGLMAREQGLSLKVYRAGLDLEERRKLEREFKQGSLKALAATSALELGMDIGSVDAVLLAGFPGTVTRVRQRIGRAGRKGQEALAVFIARENALDYYYAENPEEYLRGEPENCFVNVENELVLKQHLLASARDMPLSAEEVGMYWKGKNASTIFEELAREGLLKEWHGDFIPSKEGLKKLRELSLRGAADPVRIYDAEQKKFIGEREEAMALRELFPGAIYLHGGVKFECLNLDLKTKTAFVERVGFDSSEYTVALREREASVVEEVSKRKCFGSSVGERVVDDVAGSGFGECTLSFGRVHVIDTVFGYNVKDYLQDYTVSRRFLDEPLSYEFDTQAIWLDLPEDLVSEVDDFGSGLHAMEHVCISMMPALTGADAGELGGISYPSGRMFVYDGVAGGAGVAKVVFGKFEKIAGMAFQRLKNCKCMNGCPKCVLDPMCGNNNQYLNKESGKKILEKLLK
ncbi:DEAD/DEAH box helicase [Candidatus Micrarchaeota archaeon]|nr:DEAD/DEAH box helicase [Candidatus Micrarchaeota archaeon]